MQIWQPTQQQPHGVLYLPFLLVLVLVLVLMLEMLMIGAEACCIIIGWGAPIATAG